MLLTFFQKHFFFNYFWISSKFFMCRQLLTLHIIQKHLRVNKFPSMVFPVKDFLQRIFSITHYFILKQQIYMHYSSNGKIYIKPCSSGPRLKIPTMSTTIFLQREREVNKRLFFIFITTIIIIS